MNILFASCIEHWGGGENWMLSAALGLRDRGHGVRLAARRGSELHKRGQAAGLAVTGIRFHGDFDPVASFTFWRLCRRHRIDVLCTNMDKVLRIAGPAARLAGVDAVVPRRGSEMPIGNRISHKLTWKHIAAGAIANSEATRRTMLESAPWLPADQVRVIYNGIDLERYARPETREAVRGMMGSDEDTPVIGMVGELTGRKNHMLVVRCLPAIVERLPDAQVWIVGEGDQREELLDEAEHLGVRDHLHLLGFRDDVPELLGAVDVLAHPALMEGFGYVLVEAMASGRPVVAAATSNIPEIVVDGLTGYLCAPEDAEIWTRRLLEVLEDGALQQRLGQAGQQRAQELFSFERMISEVEAYFGELAGDPHPSTTGSAAKSEDTIG